MINKKKFGLEERLLGLLTWVAFPADYLKDNSFGRTRAQNHRISAVIFSAMMLSSVALLCNRNLSQKLCYAEIKLFDLLYKVH